MRVLADNDYCRTGDALELPVENDLSSWGSPIGECIPRRAVTGTESPMNHDIITTAGQSALGSTVRELADNSPMTGDLTSPDIPYRRMSQSNKYIKQNLCVCRGINWMTTFEHMWIWVIPRSRYVHYKQSLDGGHQYGEVIARLL